MSNMDNMDLKRKQSNRYSILGLGTMLLTFVSMGFYQNEFDSDNITFFIIFLSIVFLALFIFFMIKAHSIDKEIKEFDFLRFRNEFNTLFKANKIFIRKDNNLILGYSNDGNIFIMKKDKTETYSKLISYKDILSVEILADDKSIEKAQRESKIGAGLIGTILFGIPGLIIGGILNKGDIRKLELCLMINDTNNPYEKILFNTTKVWSGSDLLKIDIKDWFAICSILIERADKEDLEKESNGAFSISNELLKLNDLKEKGILTDEEFQTQKSRLLA